MSPETSEVVERMYEVLLEEIRAHRPELLGEGFTVAEIYQNLVPYRTHRDRIGIEMNGDYEHALVRLLVGEGGYVELESDAARRRLQEELDSVHPDTGVYRNFAACEVRLANVGAAGPGGSDRSEAETAPEGDDGSEAASAATSTNGAGLPWAEEGGGEEMAAATSEEEAGEEESEPAAEEGPRDETFEFAAAGADESGSEDGAEGEGEGEAEPPGAADPDATCRWCRERLPEREDLRFCPFCGSRIDRVPCPECGTELEEEWHFCVACGTHVQA